MTDECPIHDNLKQALSAATEQDTLPILGSLHNSLRAWKNPAAIKVAELEASQAGLNEILSVMAGTRTRRMFEEGDVDFGVLACSQGIGLVHEVKPVADVIEEMMREALTIHNRLS